MSCAVAHTVGRARAQIRERDADLYESLEKVGFMHDWGDDDSGLFMKYLRRGSGYYIDVGAVQLLVDGKVKLRSGKGLEIKRFSKNGVELNDGTKLDADLVVLATGYGSMNQWAPVPPTYVGWQVCKSSLILPDAAVGTDGPRSLSARRWQTRSASAGGSAPAPPKTPARGKASCETWYAQTT